MNGAWPTVRLASLVENGEISYGIVQPGNHCEQGVPIVRVKDLRNGVVDPRSPLRVASSVADAYRRTSLRGGELLLSIVGTIGEAAVVPESMAGWNVARAIAVIRPTEVSPHWIRLCLQTAPVRSALNGALNTTVQATLNLADLKRLEIPVPPRGERQAITEVVGALDSKLAANNRLVKSLDDLSAARWTKATQRDGDSVPLSSLANFINGKAFTKDATGTGRVVIRIAELNSGIGPSTVFNDIEVPECHMARPGDLLFAWSGSLTVSRWFRPEAIINQHIFKVVPKNETPLWLVAQALLKKLAEFKTIAADKATTMGHIQRRHLDEHVVLPKKKEVDRLDRVMRSLWHRALAAEQENLAVTKIRSELLPLLMSGQIRVRVAEKAVEEVV